MLGCCRRLSLHRGWNANETIGFSCLSSPCCLQVGRAVQGCWPNRASGPWRRWCCAQGHRRSHLPRTGKFLTLPWACCSCLCWHGACIYGHRCRRIMHNMFWWSLHMHKVFCAGRSSDWFSVPPQISLSWSQLPDLLKACDFLQVVSVTTACSDYLQAHVGPSSAVFALHLCVEPSCRLHARLFAQACQSIDPSQQPVVLLTQQTYQRDWLPTCFARLARTGVRRISWTPCQSSAISSGGTGRTSWRRRTVSRASACGSKTCRMPRCWLACPG